MDRTPPAETKASEAASPSYTLRQLVLYALKLGTVGFGGPVALVGYMHRDLVEGRGWFTEAEYKEGMTLAQLMPGPLAAQLAIYLGFVHYALTGATLVGLAFVFPSFLMVIALGWAYVQFGGLSWMQAVFYGVGPCVIGIIAHSAYKLTAKTNGQDRLLWLIYLVSAATTVITENEIIWLFLGAGALVMLARWRRPATPAAACVVPLFGVTNMPELWETRTHLLLFFTKAGAFVFGSGLAIVPFLYGGVVKEYGWLNDQQFLDAVAVAMITPGPVVITVGFIGYLVDGLPGATIAAIGTFLPCYLLTVLPAPYFKRHGQRPMIVAFVDGVTAAAVGAIAGAVLVLGRRTLMDTAGVVDPIKVALFVVTAVVLWRFRKLPEPFVIVAAALLGLLLFPLRAAP